MCRVVCTSAPHSSCLSLQSAASFIPFFFFFNDTATTEIYTLSLHDALPICQSIYGWRGVEHPRGVAEAGGQLQHRSRTRRSEEHTSELQSRLHLVCRLLLEKKKKYKVSVFGCHFNIS